MNSTENPFQIVGRFRASGFSLQLEQTFEPQADFLVLNKVAAIQRSKSLFHSLGKARVIQKLVHRVPDDLFFILAAAVGELRKLRLLVWAKADFHAASVARVHWRKRKTGGRFPRIEPGRPYFPIKLLSA